jgi:hypothetical protein
MKLDMPTVKNTFTEKKKHGAEIRRRKLRSLLTSLSPHLRKRVLPYAEPCREPIATHCVDSRAIPDHEELTMSDCVAFPKSDQSQRSTDQRVTCSANRDLVP